MWNAERAAAKTAALSITLEIDIGGFHAPSYGIWWDGERLARLRELRARLHKAAAARACPVAGQWRRFRRTTDQIGVWEWAKRYEPDERVEPESVIRDGTYWPLTLADAGRMVESRGDNAGPDAGDLDESPVFARFCEALSRLLGGCIFG